ncbi:alpha-galactosidase [Colwellia sp. 4_MG-2023]|jgi:alpha-galactosidase|uniref:glycoside hydrolase family 36 protein n=1 Tax=unclassified Colwellia TaxID=196834 RepID=UPI001C0A0D37|nr:MULTISPECIES: glycoside hydrolase family 36 protein [unclassified Colwellia]MBU2923652.1 alpha-galactosidase [Colwellia sp. C2M11]MDO6505825.1 alpha-galactosidase [Colwellia sp. 5_MG-2023]MDO6554506.1 alpha-galactosidase [Colwellia sp. 4_MG-2023]MDO6652248.1 alpha-galactosidase [Colwellia sp. 3_MG-2023]MDO6664583.1 alpha-galactosidase [Colwellia sp. 2_MG-2023]
MKKNYAYSLLIFAISLCSLVSCAKQSSTPNTEEDIVYSVKTKDITISFNNQLHSKVSGNIKGNMMSLGDMQPSEYVVTLENKIISDFNFIEKSVQKVNNELGAGTQITLNGLSSEGLIKKTIVSIYERYPTMVFFDVSYTNTSENSIKITKWVNNHYSLLAPKTKSTTQPDFWSYQGASYADRRDWITAINPGYSQQNYMGMNSSDYGGGTAVVDLWRQDIGIAVGHAETSPKLVSLPLSYKQEKRGATIHIELEKGNELKIGETLKTIQTFVNIHNKDYYATLKNYRKVMADKGLKMADVPDSAYDPVWCAWGYERNFNVDEVLGTLKKAKNMGLEWAVLDDGWQTAEGDWYLDRKKFPNGDKDMQSFVKKINDAGLKAKLWWAPLAVDPGTDLLHEHSDMLLLDKNGAVQDITWWNSFYLCPAYEGTIEHSKQLVRKMLGEWGYEGLKIDGQHLNGVAPCYNPAHNHAYPEESVEKLGEYWEEIFKTAKEINPEAVIEICPCGTSYAFHNLPYMNQTVSSDPLTSWQVRHKGKTLKGLMGDSAPYYGDHVELSDNANDFASSVGIGAIVGTKFTMPGSKGAGAAYALDDETEKTWTKWITVYKEKMLPKGVYLGELYDIGFDIPETHAIRKGANMYYAFYYDDWQGELELRGLTPGKYQIKDYINNVVLGTVDASSATLTTKFKGYLLIELSPVVSK